MSEQVKAAVILGVAAVACMALYLYFSPYERCIRGVRDVMGSTADMVNVYLTCAEKTSGQR